MCRGAVTMTDRGDGSYTIEFVPIHEGSISVHVLLDGAHIRGSPMSLSVHRDIDALARSALTGKLSTAVTGLRRGLANVRPRCCSTRTSMLLSLTCIRVCMTACLAQAFSRPTYRLRLTTDSGRELCPSASCARLARLAAKQRDLCIQTHSRACAHTALELLLFLATCCVNVLGRGPRFGQR